VGRKTSQTSFKLAGALDSRDYAVLQALWAFEQHNEEATYNRLFQVTTSKIEKMPLQTFQRRLERLIAQGLVTQTVKTESRLHFKPRVYKLAEKGREVASLNHGLISLKQYLVEKAENVPLPKLFSFFLTKMYLAAFSSPLFTFLSHGGFISFFAYDMMDTWGKLMKERAEEKPEEFLQVVAMSLAFTELVGGEPLPEETVNEVKTRLRQNRVDPEEVFRMAEEYKKALEKEHAQRGNSLGDAAFFP
jgi:DNA-binding HxlR family transcriptional regulator